MNTLTLIAMFWLVFSAWRGYKQGLPKVLAGVLGFFLGYVACFVFGWSVAQKLAGVVPPAWQWPVATAGLFLGVGLGLQVLARPLVKRYRGNRTLALVGAGVNTLMALAMLLVALWAVGLLVSMQQQSSINTLLNKAGFSPQHTLARMSSGFMAQAVGLGLTVIGAESEQVIAAKALVKAPAQGMAQLQSVTGSAQTKALLQGEGLKQAAQSGDVNTLMNDPDFVAFTRQPGIASMMTLVPRSQEQSQEQAMASTMMAVWQKVDAIKQTPQVQEAMADPEIQAIMQSGDNAALMTHPKMQPILGAVMGALATPSNAKTANTHDQPARGNTQNQSDQPSSATVVSPLNTTSDVMYKWFDGKGATHFSTWDKIPASYREGAELIHL
ncbi:CvpA family protein [Marinagarivorans algicola]|uniref:CvpA family protein n=1 Tax=Marinagarivorans algicola TaxID=1513270 RepID=UPI0006B516EC|nr:CvpA family protein [Marinagarivorans algicola]